MSDSEIIRYMFVSKAIRRINEIIELLKQTGTGWLIVILFAGLFVFLIYLLKLIFCIFFLYRPLGHSAVIIKNAVTRNTSQVLQNGDRKA